MKTLKQRTSYIAIPTSIWFEEQKQARTLKKLKDIISKDCVDYKIEKHIQKISNYDRFTEYAERESIKITPTNFRTWFNVYA